VPEAKRAPRVCWAGGTGMVVHPFAQGYGQGSMGAWAG